MLMMIKKIFLPF